MSSQPNGRVSRFQSVIQYITKRSSSKKKKKKSVTKSKNKTCCIAACTEIRYKKKYCSHHYSLYHTTSSPESSYRRDSLNGSVSGSGLNNFPLSNVHDRLASSAAVTPGMDTRVLSDHKASVVGRMRAVAEQQDVLDVINHPYGLANFRRFLKSEYAQENINFWIDVNDLLASTTDSIKNEKAHLIVAEYVDTDARQAINLKHTTKQAILESTTFDFTTLPKLLSALIFAQEEIIAMLRNDSFRRFIKSKYLERYINDTLTSGVPFVKIMVPRSASKLSLDVPQSTPSLARRLSTVTRTPLFVEIDSPGSSAVVSPDMEPIRAPAAVVPLDLTANTKSGQCELPACSRTITTSMFCDEHSHLLNRRGSAIGRVLTRSKGVVTKGAKRGSIDRRLAESPTRPLTLNLNNAIHLRAHSPRSSPRVAASSVSNDTERSIAVIGRSPSCSVPSLYSRSIGQSPLPSPMVDNFNSTFSNSHNSNPDSPVSKRTTSTIPPSPSNLRVHMVRAWKVRRAPRSQHEIDTAVSTDRKLSIIAGEVETRSVAASTANANHSLDGVSENSHSELQSEADVHSTSITSTPIRRNSLVLGLRHTPKTTPSQSRTHSRRSSFSHSSTPSLRRQSSGASRRIHRRSSVSGSFGLARAAPGSLSTTLNDIDINELIPEAITPDVPTVTQSVPMPSRTIEPKKPSTISLLLSLQPYIPTINLLQSSRHFLYSNTIFIHSINHHCYLFNDLLLITTFSYDIVEALSIDNSFTIKLHSPNVHGQIFGINIISKKKILSFTCNSVEECKIWNEMLQTAIRNAKDCEEVTRQRASTVNPSSFTDGFHVSIPNYTRNPSLSVGE